MLIEVISLLVLAWVSAATVDRYHSHKIRLSRLGTSPGPFGLLTWWGRWKWLKHGHGLVIQNYAKSKSTNSNYVIQTLTGDLVVLAPKYLDELNMLPESKLSSTKRLVDSVMGEHTGVDLLLQDHLSSDICRGPLRKNLRKHLHPGSPGLVGAATKAKIDSHEHCENKIWKDALAALPFHVEITKRNQIFRDPVTVRRVLFPSSTEPVSREEPSVTKLLIDSGKDRDPDRITARLLILSGAALHTSSMAMTHAIYNLCAMPHYVEQLRSEAKKALSEDGGEWKFTTLQKLHRLDSFLKESQRLNHTTFLGFDRQVISPIELSDGKTVLPPGTTVAVPGGPMSLDPAFYDLPTEFDDLRFYNLAQNDDHEKSTNNKYTYTGIEPGNLSWGSGRFTCPGRWYADAMIKLILANLLLKYDVSFFPNGVTDRPPNRKYNTEVHPDFEQKIVLRKRA
ncbi:cytochrome P450 [Xylariaceae sp. FL0594]|nr:cytochrome P450 [Xylariaceae sp. FL0594]